MKDKHLISAAKVKYLAVLVGALAFVLPAQASRPITIAMKDPGCHWFLVGSKYTTKLVHTGPVTLVNRDEAALKYVGPGGTKLQQVGKTITLRTRGTYRITMVGQLKHDNTLTLVVR